MHMFLPLRVLKNTLNLVFLKSCLKHIWFPFASNYHHNIIQRPPDFKWCPMLFLGLFTDCTTLLLPQHFCLCSSDLPQFNAIGQFIGHSPRLQATWGPHSHRIQSLHPVSQAFSSFTCCWAAPSPREEPSSSRVLPERWDHSTSQVHGELLSSLLLWSDLHSLISEVHSENLH